MIWIHARTRLVRLSLCHFAELQPTVAVAGECYVSQRSGTGVAVAAAGVSCLCCHLVNCSVQQAVSTANVSFIHAPLILAIKISNL